ncbi:hypothetical protein SPRG_18946 [Saprolegnia parasitica CBS 223.65]|uniref:Uncharacterized protein n=1 Tax=Saprolegnia parasitica (strain CBS 223.65) TaxID=695850 RepID=A0A067CZY0_SAPPC|nr:hypothetical protein SPRG_18946 [Saprolegnia parasitica CBS 223.65]KDO34815.1 hypothetical protein SPRG_18946 [Saprolegnia parasitica CBS 223.65]|eukprot:XP_012194815.1 hypothetical protein SPRG_18946 [Saprolegnia parasitica CBS 223.65]
MRSTWHWEERRAAPRRDVPADVLGHLQRDAAFASWLRAKQRLHAPARDVDKPRADAAEIQENFRQWLKSKSKKQPPCPTDAAPKPRVEPRQQTPATVAVRTPLPPPAPTKTKANHPTPAQVDKAYREWLKRKKEDKLRCAAALDAAQRAETERARLHRDKWSRKLVVLAYGKDA